MQWWNKILSLGTDKSSFQYIRRIRLLNAISFVSGTISTLFAPALIVTIGWKPLLFNLITNIFRFLPLYFNYKGWYYAAVSVFLIFNNLAIALTAGLSGLEGSIHYCFICLAVLGLIFFDNKWLIFLQFITSLILFLVCHEYLKVHKGIYSDLMGPNFFYATIIAIFILNFLLLFFFKTENLRYERMIEAKNQEITEKNQELEQKQEEILAQTEEIIQKNQEITKKNQEILDSIIYAKRIQEAMLPSINELKSIFPHSFIFFHPRDIVSGDFYWFVDHEGLKYIAAVDCTGHGVPGAFMSMIGSEFLNDIILGLEVKEPHLILNELDKRVRKSLKQDTSSSNDGMDIILLVIDENQKIAKVSAAMNSLYYVQNEKLFTVTANKFPIGGQLKDGNRIFSAYEIDISIPTTFYLYSDGFQDQFGGKKGRKYMKKNFYEFLLSISKFDLEEQYLQLEQEFKNWKGSLHQTDDVLVIGIKV